MECTNIIPRIYNAYLLQDYMDIYLQFITLVDKLGAHLVNILYVIEFLSYSLQGHDHF